MRPNSAIVALAALAVGVGGGSAAFRLASTAGAATPPATVSVVKQPAKAAHRQAPQQVVRGPRFAWAPCKPPAVRHGKVCVTQVVRTVVLPAAPVAAAPAPVPAAPAPAPASYGGSSGGHEQAGGQGEGADHAEAEHSDDHADEGPEDHAEDHADDGGDDGEDQPGED